MLITIIIYIEVIRFITRLERLCDSILIIVLTFNDVDSLEKLPFIRSLFRAFEILSQSVRKTPPKSSKRSAYPFSNFAKRLQSVRHRFFAGFNEISLTYLFPWKVTYSRSARQISFEINCNDN